MGGAVTKEMKIVFINTTDNKGGAADLARGLKRGLQKQGYTVTMFVRNKFTDDPNVIQIRKESGALIKLLAKVTGKDVGSFLYNKIHWLLSNDLEFFNNDILMRSKELKEADIVHCHNLHGSYFNLKNLEKISGEKPVVWSMHDMWPMTAHESWLIDDDVLIESKPHLLFNNRKHLLNKKRAIYEKSKLNIIVTSSWIIERLKNSILKEHPVHLIHNGVKLENFKATPQKEAREKLNLSQDKKIISFMASGGKGNTQKGWGYAEKLIGYYKNRNDILFLCIGGNSEDAKLSNENVQYIGYIREPEKLALYCSASDVFVNPSLAEMFCLMLIDAMSCGLPVVTFPVGIAKEAIEHKKSGYIAKYKDSEDLIRGVEYILKLDKNSYEKMRQSAIRDSKKFPLEKMIDEHIQLYKKVLDEFKQKQ